MTTSTMTRSAILHSGSSERPIRVAEVDESYRPGTPGTHPVSVTDGQNWSIEASGGINLGIFQINFKGAFGRTHSETETVQRPNAKPPGARSPISPTGRKPVDTN